MIPLVDVVWDIGSVGSGDEDLSFLVKYVNGGYPRHLIAFYSSYLNILFFKK